MLSWIRRQLSPATVMAFAALVFAMTGGAFAVTSHGGGSGSGTASAGATAAKSKSKSKAGARGPAGPRGATGAAGLAGAAGPAGPTGPAGGTGPAGTGTQGEKGVQGEKGETGVAGKAGASVTNETIAPGGSECGGQGGAKFKVGSGGTPTTACNGTTGFTKTLPKGETETGVWSVDPTGSPPKFSVMNVPIASFSIPLAKPLKDVNGEPCQKQEPTCQVHVIISETGEEVTAFEGVGTEEPKDAGLLPQKEEPKKPCPGTAEEPKAEPGELCVYVAEAKDLAFASDSIVNSAVSGSGTGKAGAFAQAFIGTNGGYAYGAWAVTAE